MAPAYLAPNGSRSTAGGGTIRGSIRGQHIQIDHSDFDGMSHDRGIAAGGGDQTGEHRDGCALPSSIGSQKAEHLAGFSMEGCVLHGLELAK